VCVAAASATTLPSGRHRLRGAVLEVVRAAVLEVVRAWSPPRPRRRLPAVTAARPTRTNGEAEARPCRRCAGDQRYHILPVRCASPSMLPTNCLWKWQIARRSDIGAATPKMPLCPTPPQDWGSDWRCSKELQGVPVRRYQTQEQSYHISSSSFLLNPRKWRLLAEREITGKFFLC
jgi:hypothetical protein